MRAILPGAMAFRGMRTRAIGSRNRQTLLVDQRSPNARIAEIVGGAYHVCRCRNV